MKIEINKEILKILNDTYCVYENGTKKGEKPINCGECILRDIKWIFFTEKRKKQFTRDLCFAIYHEHFLK